MYEIRLESYHDVIIYNNVLSSCSVINVVVFCADLFIAKCMFLMPYLGAFANLLLPTNTHFKHPPYA